MSPRRSSTTAVSHEIEQDVVMNGSSSSAPQTTDQELAQMYGSLKRRYHELEEVSNSWKKNMDYSLMLIQNQEAASGTEPEERNVKMRNERRRLFSKSYSSIAATRKYAFKAASITLTHSPEQSTNAQGDNGVSPSSSPSSRGHSQQSSHAPASGRPRSIRRSSRISSTDQTHVEDGAEAESVPKTRGATKRPASFPTVKARLTRSETAALAAAAKAAQTESAASSSTVLHGQAHTSSTSSPSQPEALTSTSNEPTTGENVAQSDFNIDPSLVAAETNRNNEHVKEPSPMDNIVKVAEAAIAAQLAASNSQAPSAAPSTSASPVPSHTHSATATPAKPSTSSSPSSYNPYMITTQMLPSKPNTGMMSPLSMNPYAMYYAPGTPVTPATPYSPYANPYFYLTAPMAGPGGMYPPNTNFPQPSAQQPPPKGQPQPKPKRLKAHTVTSKSFSIPMVPRDKQGKPMLPLNVGIMTVISLGDVCMREHFHTERYIFPVGYEVTRRYLSTIDLNHEVVYHCTILDGGDGPKFQIVPSDVPDRPVIAGTATGAWSSIVKQANAIRNRQHSNSVSGPDFFGLGQNTIKHLIQELPNADRLRDYVWQTFVEGGPLGGRHAAVIPALPEEYDASIPIGAYYPTERDKRKREASNTPNTPAPKGISHYPQHIMAQAEAQRAQQHALQQAQQMGAHPLQSGESSRTGQIDASMMNFQEYRPQLETSADRTPDGNPLPSASAPATFASILNAYSASAEAGAPTPTQ
ncbi:hypothetical protein C0991_008019 [Blastosporella zonata]|nr:hypothetical protein C0991_008019 [Blastosporella zonata]